MRILHVNAGNEFGGGLFHIVSLFQAMENIEMELLVFEEGPVSKAARESGITVHVMQQRSRYDIKVLKRLTEFIRKNQYDIVHTHGPRANVFLSMIYFKLANTKWIMTIHSNPFLDFKGLGVKGKLFEWINLKSLKRADYVIAVSNEIQNLVITYGVEKNRVDVIHNGITVDEKQEPLFDKQMVFTLLTAGRLEWVKGYDYLLEALSLSKLPHWKLIMCGNGTKEADLQQKAKELGIDQNIDFTGWISKDSLTKYYREAEVMVISSLSETFPLAALEAGQNGLALIATNVGDMQDILPKKELGWLISPRDSESLSKVLVDAYTMWEEGQLIHIKKNFHEWSKQFTSIRQANATEEVYKKVVMQNEHNE